MLPAHSLHGAVCVAQNQNRLRRLGVSPAAAKAFVYLHKV
jgi:hypothetical protein